MLTGDIAYRKNDGDGDEGHPTLLSCKPPLGMDVAALISTVVSMDSADLKPPPALPEMFIEA